MTSKSKFKQHNEPISTDTKTDKPNPIIDFMDKWAKEEKCYRDAIVRDYNTKKIVVAGWPREKPTEQAAYENWLAALVNKRYARVLPGKKFRRRSYQGNRRTLHSYSHNKSLRYNR